MFLLACEMSAIVQRCDHSLALPFFGIGMKTFSSPVATAEFSKFAGIQPYNFFFVLNIFSTHPCIKLTEPGDPATRTRAEKAI